MSLLASVNPVTAITAATTAQSASNVVDSKKSQAAAALDFAKALDDAKATAPSSNGDGVIDKLADAASLAATVAAFV